MLPRFSLLTRLAAPLSHSPLFPAPRLLHSTTATAAMSSNKQQQTDNAPATNHHKDEPAAAAAAAAHPLNTLPAPGGDGSSSDPSTPVLDISGGDSTVSLDAMGPVVVNKDGTVSRVTNWGKMTELEKETTLRVLGKRNKQRLAALKEAEAASSKQ